MLLKKMGYEVQGLGKNDQGQKTPTKIDTRPLHVSLGYHGGVVEKGECYNVSQGKMHTKVQACKPTIQNHSSRSCEGH